jgi:hypothetical protein
MQILGHDSPHCGVVIDDHRIIELIAIKNEQIQQMFCKLVVLDFSKTDKHPLTHKIPSYKLRKKSSFPWTQEQLKDRIKALRPKYEDQEYHIIYKNCQHFAWELATGEAKSPNADMFSVIGGPIGLMTKIKDFGSESSSVSLTDLMSFQDNLRDFLLL